MTGRQGPLALGRLHAGELVARLWSRLSFHPVSARPIAREGARMLRAHRIEGFDSTILYPEFLVIEVAAEVVDRLPELFTGTGCAAITEQIASRVRAADGSSPVLAVQFERVPALERGFRVTIPRHPR